MTAVIGEPHPHPDLGTQAIDSLAKRKTAGCGPTGAALLPVSIFRHGGSDGGLHAADQFARESNRAITMRE